MLRIHSATMLFLVLLIIGCGGTDGYVGGLLACKEFQRLLPFIQVGILTDAEIREMTQTIQSHSSSAEPAIKTASTNLLRGTTQGDTEGFAIALEEMADACRKAGYLGGDSLQRPLSRSAGWRL